jgi:hypothetical protein
MFFSVTKTSMRWTAIVAATSVTPARPDETNPKAHSTLHIASPKQRLPKNVNGYWLAVPSDMIRMMMVV